MTHVSKALAEAVRLAGCDRVFGLMGDANMAVMAHLDAMLPAGAVVHVRHEGAALAMADGYARATDRVGVCSVTCGPGVTQLATSLVVASRRRSPVVVLAGDTPRGTAATHLQGFDICAFVRACGAGSVRVTEAGDARAAVARTFAQAATERRPVVLCVPLDLMDALASDSAADDGPARRASRTRETAAPAAVARVVDLLRGSRRPLVLAGAGAVASGCRKEILGLAELLGAPVGTTLRARGWFDGHPRDLGVVGGFSREATREVLARVDCVVALGSSINPYTTDHGSLFAGVPIVVVDDDPHQGGDDRMVRLLGDARAVVEQIRSGLSDVGDREDWCPPVGTGLPSPGVYEGDDPAAALALIDRLVPKEWPVVVGVGHFWNFVVDALTGRSPDHCHFCYDFGTIGHGLPVAIGVGVGSTGPVVAIEGDGSLLVHVQELETLARHPLPLLLLVMNDGAYGAEYHKLRAQGLDGDLAVFGKPDFAALARAAGLEGRTVASSTGLRRAIEDFTATPRPFVVDVRLDHEVVSRQYRRALGHEPVSQQGKPVDNVAARR